MSLSLNPDIAALDPASLCHAIYTQLYQSFYNAQDAGTLHEGDGTSIRLHNTAYDFAAAIAGAVAGDGGTGGGVLMRYLPKTGGDMSGLLRARYGFEAGHGNIRVLEVFAEPVTDVAGNTLRTDVGLAVTGELRLGGSALRLGGHCPVSYGEGTLHLTGPHVVLAAQRITTTAEILVGVDAQQGLYLSPQALRLRGHDVYHAGTANLRTVDWAMRDATVAGDLRVGGVTEHTGLLRALQGAELGVGGTLVAALYPGELALRGDLSLGEDCGIRMDGHNVLVRLGERDIALGGIGGDLLLGGTGTGRVRLVSPLYDADGEHPILTPYGRAYFPASLVVRHNYGGELLSSYRLDAADEGMIVHRRLRFASDTGCYMEGAQDALCFTSEAEHTPGHRAAYITRFRHSAATSLYAPQNRPCGSFQVSTDAEFLTTQVPIEARGHLGIDGARTRLMAGRLELAPGCDLQARTDGIVHSGAAYFAGDLSSEGFAAGYAGTGWGVQRSATTGNITATYDELVVRRRMRVYQLEVQRLTATNGALWVSDSCAGDYVEEL